MSESDPHFVPEPDRAPGEPGVGGLRRNEAEEQAAAQTAPEIWEAFRQQFPDYWYRMAVEQLRRDGPPVSILLDFLPDPTKADRAPLRRHLDQELRAGLWVCFGFSEQREGRARIASPGRAGLAFDDSGGMTTAAGARYSDVLFYQVEAPPASPTKSKRGRRNSPRPAALGRPKGSGSYEAADKPLIASMRQAIRANPSLAPQTAARAVAGRALGGGSIKSKVERLARRYRDKFGC